MTMWMNIGIIFLVIAAATFGVVFLINRDALIGYRWSQKLSLLLTHIPDADAAAWPHVFGGVSLFLGICLLVGAAVANMSFVVADFNRHSAALTAGGFAFAVMVSVVSFLTLGQTKKIEQAQGANIDGFRDLIRKIHRDLKAVNDDFLTNNFRAREHHRVFLITSNPFLGRLSYPTDPIAGEFSDALRHSAECVGHAPAALGRDTFTFEVICGNPDVIRQFHREFYRGPGGTLAPEDDPQVKTASEMAERLIAELNTAAGKTIVHRVPRVPKTQFSVVGNVVYEFILETPGFHSEVHRARRIGDKVVCDRFLETFHLLKELAAHSPP